MATPWVDVNGNVWWEALCAVGNDQHAIWAPEMTIYTTSPKLTICFMETVLSWIPSLVLFMCTPFYLCYLYSKPTIHDILDFSILLLIKLAVGILLLLLCAAQITNSLLKNDVNPPGWLITQCILFLTIGLALILAHMDYRKGQSSSGVIFIFWLLATMCDTYIFVDLIMNLSFYLDDDAVRAWLNIVFYSLVAAEFCMHLFSDTDSITSTKKDKTGETTPLLQKKDKSDEIDFIDINANEISVNPQSAQIRASFLSRMFFTWNTRIMYNGFRNRLTSDSLFQLRKGDKCKSLISKFYTSWLSSQNKRDPSNDDDKYYIPNISLEASGVSTSSTKDPWNTIPGVDILPGPKKLQGVHPAWGTRSSLISAIIKSFGTRYALVGILELVHILLAFLRPFIMGWMIREVFAKDPYVWHGYFYAALLFLVSILKSIVGQQNVYIKYLMGYHVRTALSAAIYRKSLLLSSAERKKFSSFDVVNLMAVDTQRIQDSSLFLHNLWSTFLNLSIALWILWRLLGIASLAGFGVIVLMLSVNVILVHKVKHLQEKAMNIREQRTRLTNEALDGIKTLKLLSWESIFAKKIKSIREKELKLLRSIALYQVGTTLTFQCVTILFTVAAFTTYFYINSTHQFTLVIAFVSIAVVSILQRPVSLIPICISNCFQGWASMKKIERFLNARELDQDAIKQNTNVRVAIEIRDGRFSWERLSRHSISVLSDINVRMRTGKLTMVVGHAGCGKSSLLNAILGELHKEKGSVYRTGSVAYVPQEPWILNMNIRENILLGRTFSDERYFTTIHYCGLEPDLAALPSGDMTDVGERQGQLSIAQRRKICLARAAYQNSDIYLLDEPLSNMDGNVGRYIFRRVISLNGILSHKTRIMVTNQVGYLPYADEIIVMKDGKIAETGSYDDLINSQGAFAEYIKGNLHYDQDSEQDDVKSKELKKELLKRFSSDSEMEGTVDRERKTKRLSKRHRKNYRQSMVQRKVESFPVPNTMTKLRSAMYYVKSMGWYRLLAILVLYIITMACNFTSNWWLATRSSLYYPNITALSDELGLDLGVYGGIAFGQVFGLLLMLFILVSALTSSGRNLHSTLIHRIVRAPLTFFERNAMGRIMGCFNQDIFILDMPIRVALISMARGIVFMVTMVVAITYVTPIFLAFFIPILVGYIVIWRFYVNTANQLRPIGSALTGPVYSHFAETMTGATSIRAFSCQQHFTDKADALIDKMQMAFHPINHTGRWLMVWIDILGDFVVLLTAVLALIPWYAVAPNMLALSITYALMVTDQIGLFIITTSQLEHDIMSMIKIHEMSNTPQEETPGTILDSSVSLAWPSRGQVSFSNYTTHFRPEQEPLLKNVNVSINPGEKIGVVGRSRSGKSSLTLALYRIIQPTEGAIIIDDINTSEIGIHQLRQKLTIIPQEPVLFSGSLRSNVDPGNTHTDGEVWEALEKAYLRPFVSNLSEGLFLDCAAGANLSVGQRQLVCLARALLKKNRILIVEESPIVDPETEELMHSAIKKEFSECTVITIAHQLRTVLEYDRVMVLEHGRVWEYACPKELMQDKQSLYYGLCQDAGLA